MEQWVYVLIRAKRLVGVFRNLKDAQDWYPGTWSAVYNGPIRTPEEWNLGDATIRTEILR